MISLEATQLKKSFGATKVFSDVSFELRAGSLGIAGPNGSGKSTFLKCLGNLLRPTEGDLSWRENEHVLSGETLQQKLGYAAPYINLYEQLSCRENLAFLSKVRHESNSSGRIENWLQKVELAHAADQPFDKLSTGQQQRMRLASALFHQPDILLLDEPGSNLDKAGRKLVADIAYSFQKPDKMLVIASNNPDELKLCESIFSIEEKVFISRSR